MNFSMYNTMQCTDNVLIFMGVGVSIQKSRIQWCPEYIDSTVLENVHLFNVMFY